MAGRGVQVPLGDHILQQIDEGGAGIRAGIEVHHIVGAAQLKERLGLEHKREERKNNHQTYLHDKKNLNRLNVTVLVRNNNEGGLMWKLTTTFG